MVLYFAGDLLWATRIKGTAEALGVPCRPARTVEMLEARLAEGGVRGLIADLDAPDAALALIARFRELAPAGRIVAFGPHVATEDLARARAAGADTVLARGAFDRRLPELLRVLHDGP